MKYLNKISSIMCSAALGLLVLTGCEGADLYGVTSHAGFQAIDQLFDFHSQKHCL